jgi:hypothetical protein
MARYTIFADCQDAPATLPAPAGARAVQDVFPQTINNRFLVANATGAPAQAAKFTGNSQIIITGARLDFIGAVGLRPAVIPPVISVAKCEFGLEDVALAFPSFGIWLPAQIVIPAAQSIGGFWEPTWNGSANPAIGRARVVYDSLNLQTIFEGAQFYPQLLLEIDVAGEVL